MLIIEIDSLPQNITPHQAVESCYSEQIRFVWNRLKEGISVIVKCEKQIIPYIQSILKKRLAAEGLQVSIVDGSSYPDLARLNAMVQGIRDLLNNVEKNKVFFLPYLDIITSTSKTSLSIEGKEIMTIIHENPFLSLLAFEDPDFKIPDLITQAFPAQIEMIGIPRDKISQLITSNEASKFAEKNININELYKYVSGLNPIKFRHIMSIFAKKADYNSKHPETLKDYYKELREYTLRADSDLSDIRLDEDIAGYEKVKEKIKLNILDLLHRASQSNDEKKVKQIESLIPKGMIFYGPPGTGKTLFAKGIAESLNASVYIVSGPELKSKWVGEGEANIRTLFAKARSTAPSIIVFDEFDSIASSRSLNSTSASEASHSMVNQLLTEMDGFRKEEMIFLIGTTNFPQSLDPAFLRPGRFEYKIEIPYPEWEDRKAIIELYNKKLELNLDADTVDMLTGWTSRLTENATRYTGDDIYSLCRNIKRYLIRENLEFISEKDLLNRLKSENKKHNFQEGEDKIVAVHEIGHTLVYHKYNRLDEVKHVTIESGITDALGMVELKDNKEQNLYTEKVLKENIAMSLGGYVAEKVLFGQVSTGAFGDLKNATHIAEQMVTSYGMGALEIPRAYTDEEGRINPYYNNVVSPQIDTILFECLNEIQKYFIENKALIEDLSNQLLEKRTIDITELKKILING